ncbi:MAG: archaeosortase/exosortase family protein [Kiritimatiellia bacterium]
MPIISDVSESRDVWPWRILLFATTALLAGAWFIAHARTILLTENGIIRFFGSLFFATLIFFRRASAEASPPSAPRAPVMLTSAVVGTLLALSGLVFRIRQFEWLGLLGILWAVLRGALPPRYGHNLLASLFLLYWAHPLPNRLLDSLQLRMQWLSTHGSEWLLHLFNVRVWADGMTVVTPFFTYGIPEWCSGMRTATTVFIMALGLGVLKRWRWHRTAILVGASLIQAILLNILRIAAMVVFVRRETDTAGLDFLHNTTAPLVIFAVILVYLELLWWEAAETRRRQRAAETTASLQEVITRPPPVLDWLIHHWRRILLPLASATLLALVLYRSRPAHRYEMIRDVALALGDRGDLETAQRAAEFVMQYDPEDTEWQLHCIRILLARGRHEEALTALERTPAESPERRLQMQVLRAYALMGLDRFTEAATIVNSLPDEVKLTSPQVAMVLARLAALADDLSAVEKYLSTAARWIPNLPRVRSLYPYLRLHRRWETIATTDRPLPYTDIAQALAACEAAMNLNDPARVSAILLSALEMWPADSRLLEPLFFMARRGGMKWEERFGDYLLACLAEMNQADTIYPLFEKCFHLARPDLAWAVYRRIAALDPTHPGLRLAAARYGHLWFVFRKHFLGMQASSPRDTYDIRPLLLLARLLPLQSERWQDWIPLAEELKDGVTTAIRKQFLNDAIAEFERRYAARKLSLPLQLEFARALEMTGNVDAVRQLLESIARNYPEHKEEVRILLSEVFERKGEWQQVYECLRGYPTSDSPHLKPLLRLFAAQYFLNLGNSALYSARVAFRLYPTSTQALDALATALRRYDSPEDALFLLSWPRVRKQRSLDFLEAEMLYETQRYTEANSFRRSALLPQITIPAEALQSLVLPPAELALMRHRIYLPRNRSSTATPKSYERI